MPRTHHRLSAALPVLVAVAMYGRHLLDAPLSDDYEYLAVWHYEGLYRLLRRVTVDSYPQTLRPLPALIWTASSLGGFWLVKALHLAVHAACASLISATASRSGKHLWTAAALGSLFAAFPLISEAVHWASAAPDGCAALFGILALVRWQSEAPRPWLTLALYVAALLSKESVAALPLVGLVLGAPRRTWLAKAVLVTTTAYVLLRLLLFGGVGGYALQAPAFADLPAIVVSTLVGPLRYIAAVPLRDPSSLGIPIGFVSLACCAALLPFHRTGWGRVAVVALASGLALVPAAPAGARARDFSGGRLFYFPTAVFFLGIALLPLQVSRVRGAAAIALLALWMACTLANGRAWSAASRITRTAMRGLADLAPRLPRGTVVMADMPDSIAGAYVFRNGFQGAVRLYGLPAEITWRRGTLADLDAGELISRDVLTVDPVAGLDWTACDRRAAETEAPTQMETLEDFPSPPLRVPEGNGVLYLRLRRAGGPGWFLWNQGGREFRGDQSRTFGRLDPVTVRLAKEPSPGQRPSDILHVKVTPYVRARPALVGLALLRVGCAPDPLAR